MSYRDGQVAAQYGESVAPHEFHWNPAVPGLRTCTCGRTVEHPLHLQEETSGDHLQTKLDDNPYGRPAPSRCICLRAPYDPDRLRADIPGHHHAPTCKLYRRKPRRRWTPTRWELGVAFALACLTFAVTGWILYFVG